MNTVQVQLGQSEALPHPLKKDLAGHWVLGKAGSGQSETHTRVSSACCLTL